MTTLTVRSTDRLEGTTTVPGDKSISHRSLILGMLAPGLNRVRGWLAAGDTLATLGVVRALGVDVRREGNTLTFEGGTLHAPDAPLDCVNAGTLMRLMAGALAGQPFEAVLDGSEQLRQRPMRRITEPLAAMGADITAQDDGTAPLHIRPAELHGHKHHLKVASAQVKSAILLAGLRADGETVVHEPGPSRDHTERMLGRMGVPIRTEGRATRLTSPGEPLRPIDLTVPGDMSSAAFLMVAAACLASSDVRIVGVGLNPTRTGIIDVLRAMGADLTVEEAGEEGGEPVGTLHIRGSDLAGIHIGGDLVVRAIDELPIIALAATQAHGETHITDAAELRVKEVDRIAMVAQELRKFGAEIEERPDGMVISGPTRLHGAHASSHGDHRLGMACAVAGLMAEGETHIEDAACIADSFPGFAQTLAALGANV